MRYLLVLSFLFVSLLQAESPATKRDPETAASVAENIKSATEQSTSGFVGWMETRPTYKSSVGEFHTENDINLGYQFTTDSSLWYRQEFNTNLYNPSASATQGTNLIAMDGYFRAFVNNITQEGPISFNYEGRFYLPTHGPSRDAGMITTIRNHAIMKYTVNSSLDLMLAEIPILYVYNKANHNGVANPSVANRIEALGLFHLGENTNVFVPLRMTNTLYRQSVVPGVALSNSWGHVVDFNPEVYYRLNPNVQIGAGFLTSNLIKSDFSALTIGEGFKNSFTQLIFIANL